jgi:hypothetical protein
MYYSTLIENFQPKNYVFINIAEKLIFIVTSTSAPYVDITCENEEWHLVVKTFAIFFGFRHV